MGTVIDLGITRAVVVLGLLIALLAATPALAHASNSYVGAARTTPGPAKTHKPKKRLKVTLLIHYKVRGKLTRIRGIEVPHLHKRGIVYVGCAGYYVAEYCPWQGLLKVHNHKLSQLIGWLRRYRYHDGLFLVFTFEAPHKKPAVFLLHFRDHKKPHLKYFGD
jgi:hypothetical protein